MFGKPDIKCGSATFECGKLDIWSHSRARKTNKDELLKEIDCRAFQKGDGVWLAPHQPKCLHQLELMSRDNKLIKYGAKVDGRLEFSHLRPEGDLREASLRVWTTFPVRSAVSILWTLVVLDRVSKFNTPMGSIRHMHHRKSSELNTTSLENTHFTVRYMFFN